MAKHTSKCLHWSATPLPAASCAQLPFKGVSLLSVSKMTPIFFLGSKSEIPYLDFTTPPIIQAFVSKRKPPLPNPSFPYDSRLVLMPALIVRRARFDSRGRNSKTKIFSDFIIKWRHNWRVNKPNKHSSVDVCQCICEVSESFRAGSKHRR